MKKLLTFSLILATMLVSSTGCLKDKGFDNNEYGINDPDTQPPGVGFPLAANKKNGYGLDVSGSTQSVTGLIYVNLEAGSPASSDITVTLTNQSTAMVAAYNTANGTNIQVLSPSLYTVPSLTLVIPAGQRSVQVPINISSTLTLDPNKSYGLGFSITAVSNNLKIASNLKDLLIEFSIKNKYDGKYNLKGFHNRSSPDYTAPYDETVHMITSGPNSVSMYWPAAGLYAHPIKGGTSYYGSFTTNFYFDLSTNVLTAWDLTPYATTVTPSVNAGSRYDPVAKIIYASFYYNGNPGGRGFFDTLTYLGPR
jgi:hypothetical protein